MALKRLISSAMIASRYLPIIQPHKKFSKCREKPPHEARHNYDEEVEGAVNQQILTELNASMAYLSMFCYYGRTDVALPGFQVFFNKMYLEETEHAMQFINYQLLRGGSVKLYPVTAPEKQDWGCITVALGVALEMEKLVKEKLEGLMQVAEEHGDIQLVEMVAADYIGDQNRSIQEIGRLLTRAKRMVDTGPIGEYLFDKEMHKVFKDKENKELSKYK